MGFIREEVEYFDSPHINTATPKSSQGTRQATPQSLHAATPTSLTSQFPTPTNTPESVRPSPLSSPAVTALAHSHVSSKSPLSTPGSTPSRLFPCRPDNGSTSEDENAYLDKWLYVISQHRITDRTYKDLSQLCMCMPR